MDGRCVLWSSILNWHGVMRSREGRGGLPTRCSRKPMVIEQDCAERVGPVQPILEVIVIHWVIIRKGLARQAVWPGMSFHWHMHQAEQKEKDAGDPPIDGHIGLEIQIVDHTFYIFGIHFDCEVSKAKNKNPDCSQGTNSPYNLSLAWE